MSDHAPKFLKFIVISMGFVIVGGFLFVGAVIAQRMSKPKTAESGLSQVDCSAITLPALPDANWQWSDGQWIATQAGTLHRYSACGELLQTVTLP